MKALKRPIFPALDAVRFLTALIVTRAGFDRVSALCYLGVLTFPIYLLPNNFGMLIEKKIERFGVGQTAALRNRAATEIG